MKFMRAVALAAALGTGAVSVSASISHAQEMVAIVQTATGVASCYGGKFHGRRTASGESIPAARASWIAGALGLQ
jgi:rare lipoprotein A